MYPHRGFCMGKGPLKTIRRVWNIQLGIALVGKKIGQISSDAEVCRSESPVSVMPPLGYGIDRFLFEELAPPCVPLVKESREVRFGASGKGKRNGSQPLSRFEVRSCRQIPRHNLDLMELAHLYGNTGKCFSYAFFTINDQRLYGKSTLGEIGDTPLIHRRRFGHDSLPVQVLFSVRIAHDDNSPISAEEHGIGDDHDRTRLRRVLGKMICIELCADPPLASMVFPYELVNGAVVVGVLVPEGCTKRIGAPLIFKLLSAYTAFVPLFSSEKSVLFGSGTIACWAGFGVFL